MNDSNMTFYWHDYETFGANPMRDRPVQFAGIRTDADLNVIGDPLVIFCRPSDDYLPHPEACFVTGITPQQALSEGVSEAEFAHQINAEFAVPGTCSVGYNSLRFDDEVSRYCFYRNFIDPYAREWQNGNSRWDLIDVMRMARSLRPDGIVWPTYEDGTPSMRLEDLTRANGLSHESAHDALSDVYATIAVAKLLKEKQPRLYDYALTLKDKRRVASMLDVTTCKPILHISSRYPIEFGNAALVAPLAYHPTNKNAVIAYDLRVDPTPMLRMDAAEIRDKLYTASADLAEGEARIPLKLIHINRCPMLAPANMLTKEEAEKLQISGDLCRAHLAMIRGARNLQDKLHEVYAENTFEAQTDPDYMLYSGGFFSPGDRSLMNQVVQADEDQLAEMVASERLKFEDPRLAEMLFRYRARNFPDSLDEADQLRWEEFRRERLMDGAGGNLSFEAFYQRLNELGADESTTSEQMHLLHELAAYAESIYPL